MGTNFVGFFFIGIISILGNGCVVLVFTTTKALRTPSNLFVVNLAFSDFMMMATNAPAMVVNCYHETWHFGGKSLMLQLFIEKCFFTNDK